jgi:glucose dehydrogenase
MPLVIKTLLFVSQGDPILVRTPPLGGKFGNKIRAYEKDSGKVVWEMELPAGATGSIITYMYNGRLYIVVPIGSRAHEPEFVALSLPSCDWKPGLSTCDRVAGRGRRDAIPVGEVRLLIGG